MSSPELQEVTRAKMNLETARIAWHELQRFFASGSAIYVDPALDLVEVAYQISEDNKEQVLKWMETRQLAPVTGEQAHAWHDADTDMWAVVVSPYVLVQPVVEPQH
ncbi:MAG TPA: DUF2288 domain-containing protein [Gallionellaceae bacterium]|nr:DUF2288 domain-containing protein [Gallionellaceae bacterium]